MLKYHVIGLWRYGQIAVCPAPSSYRSTPDVEAAIDAAWRKAKSQLGDALFDGPMCRLESFEHRISDRPPRDPADAPASRSPHRLVLHVSATSYRIFLGTNMANPALPDHCRANPIGVSTLIVTADDFLMLGRRSGNVAYYPHRVHPFAGTLEPADPIDLFENARRELHEELALSPGDLTDIACLGLVEDLRLRHPEAILRARTRLPRRQVESRLHAHEHDDVWSCPATNDAIDAALRDPADFTPVAIAAMNLIRQFG